MSRLGKLIFPHDQRPDHFKALDGLRGLAVLLVLLSHSSNHGMKFTPWLDFGGAGKIGVYLFFVLSAYLLDRQIAIKLRSGTANSLYWKNYILRRFLRIYPLFLLALICQLWLYNMNISAVIHDGGDVAEHMALLKGVDIFWSIPVEFKYYLLSPCILLICHYVLRWRIMAMAALFAVITVGSIMIGLKTELSNLSTILYLPIFIIGTIAAIYELMKDEKGLLRFGTLLDAVGLTSLAIIIITLPYYLKSLFGSELELRGTIFFLPYAGLWGLMLLAAKHGRGVVRRIFEWRGIRFIGVVSYSAYLFHMPVINLMQTFPDMPSWLKTVVFLMITFIVSSISYLLFEKPLSRIRLK